MVIIIIIIIIIYNINPFSKSSKYTFIHLHNSMKLLPSNFVDEGTEAQES